jgi:hypothetical protein
MPGEYLRRSFRRRNCNIISVLYATSNRAVLRLDRFSSERRTDPLMSNSVAGAGFGWYLVVDSSLSGDRRDDIVDVWIRWRGW